MPDLLHRVAELLWARHAGRLDRIAVVMPSRRAGLYLQKYLAAIAGRSFWAPELLDAGTLMERLSGRRQAGTIELLFMLYEVYRERSGDRAAPLAEFMQWAPVTLRDMSEVDAHVLDLDDLYRDLRNYHEIEEWSFRLGEPSPSQARLLQQWKHTGDLHRGLLELMAQRGVGTSGSLARSVAEQAANGKLDLPWESVWFVGANAMEPALLAVAEHLQRAGKAEFAWDTDLFHLDDRTQEAGEFLRRSMARLGPGLVPPVDLIRTRPRSFRTVAVAGSMAQVRFAAAELGTMEVEARAGTTVVLADESLLMPLLEALPGDIGPLNITMGTPLRALPVHGLLEALIGLHLRSTAGGALLRDLEQLFAHPFLHQGEATVSLISTLYALERERPGLADVEAAMSAVGLVDHGTLLRALVPMTAPKADGMPTRVTALIAHARELHPDDPLVQEQLFRSARLQQQLHHGLDLAGAGAIELEGYAAVRDRALRDERIPFQGEPLSGMQVMGMLETRAIGFERVMILGANDGHLPPAAVGQSWIPFEVRRAKGLPLAGHGAMVSAYHFQRLAQYTDALTLVYDTGDEAGDPSRFIAQWQREVVGVTATTGTHLSVAADQLVHPTPLVRMVRSERANDKLRALLAHGLSPSALGTWLNCPLDFHFKYLLGIEVVEGPDGKLGADVLGSAVHVVMEDLYRPWLGKPPDGAALATGTDLHRALHDRLLLRFPAATLAEGHFKLRIEMAAFALQRHLAAEAERLARVPTMLVDLEQRVSAELAPGVRISGRCDRVELRQGVHHILDLKTGGAEARDLELEAIDPGLVDARHRYALQLLVYAWCYLEQHPTVPEVRAGIIPLQRGSQAEGLFLRLGDEDAVTRAMLPQVRAMLLALVERMTDPDVPVEHRPESRFCACCVPTA